MASREYESVTVEPLRILRVVLKDIGVENSADLGAAKRKSKMTRMRLRN